MLLSATTTDLVRDELPEGVSILDLGKYMFKGMSRPECLDQLEIQGFPTEFPPLKLAKKKHYTFGSCIV